MKIPFKLPLPVLSLIFGRMILLFALPPESIHGFGDFPHFFDLAALQGWPYIHYWVEFPPLFAFLNEILYLLAQGKQHVYEYLFAGGLIGLDAISLWSVIQLRKSMGGDENDWREWFYMALLIALPYTWWYFDPLAVCFFVLGLLAVVQKREKRAGIWWGLGIITKLFPVVALPALWKLLPRRQALVTTMIAIILPVMVYGSLFFISPKLTWSALTAQGGKGSWETIWALLDGNMETGNVGAGVDHYQPLGDISGERNPAVIPSFVSLLVIGGAGLWFFWKSEVKDTRQWLALTGATWCILMIWSPGWSPQWILMIFPLILLTLEQKKALLFIITLVVINLLEWPVLLSRGYEQGLWVTAPVRTLLFILLVVEWSGLLFRINNRKVTDQTTENII